MRRTRLYIVVVLLLGAVAGPGVSRQLQKTFLEGYWYVQPVQVHPKVLKLVAADNGHALAAYQWLELLSFFGERILRKDLDDRDIDWVHQSLVSQLYLDPYTLDTYVMAASLFPFYGDRPDYAMHLLLYGALQRTLDWRIYLAIGYNFWGQFGVTEAARRAWTLGGQLDRAPRWLPGLSAMILLEEGRLDAALMYIGTVLEANRLGTDDPFSLELKKMHTSLQGVKKLQQATQAYHERYGYWPADWDALIAAGLLVGYPVDPFGEVFVLDSTNGQVSTKTNMLPHRADIAKKAYRKSWLDVDVAQNLLHVDWNIR